MADLIVKMTGDDKLSPTLQKIKKELGDLGNSGSKLDQIKAKFDKIQNSTAPLKKRLGDVKKLLAEMNMEGLSDNGLYAQMAQQAGQYADALGDASTAVKQFANDNMNLQAAAQGMQAITGAATVATGVMGMFGVENENVNAAILKVQSALAICNGVQAVANTLNKDSVLMLKLKALATTGASVTTTTFSAALTKHAVVEALTTAKQKIATAVQTAWNVAKAIGMAMLGNFTGLALLAAGAVVGLAMATRDDTDATEENTQKKGELAEESDKLKKIQENYYNSITQQSGKLIGQYKALQIQWNSLSSDVERATWLVEKKNEIEQLGFAFDSVAEAEKFFNESTAAVVNALMKRAEAAAAYNLYLESLQNLMRLKSQKWVTFNYEGEKGGEDWQRKRAKAQEEHRQAIRNAEEQKDAVEDIYKTALAEESKANAAVEQFTPKSKGNSGGGKSGGGKSQEKKPLTEAQDNNTLSFAQDYLRQLQDARINIPVDATEDLAKNGEAIDKWKKEVERRKLIIEPAVSLPEGSLEYAEDMASKAEAALKNVDINLISPEELETAKQNLEKWKKEAEERKIKLGLEVKEPKESVASIIKPEDNKFFDAGSIEDLRASLGNANSIIDQIKSDYASGFINAEEAQNQIDEINSKLEELGLEPIDIHINDDGSISSLKEDTEKLKEEMDALRGIMDGMGGTVTNSVKNFEDLTKVLSSDQANTTEKIGASLATVGNSLEALGVEGPAAKVGSIMAAIGQIMLGFATASAQASTLGPFGWLAFLGAGMGAAAAIIGQIKSFAEGGIVSGATYYGDKIPIMANAGEVVLNKRQQSNLFNLLDSRGGMGNVNGKVEFKISGSTLKGCLNNYDKQINRAL